MASFGPHRRTANARELREGKAAQVTDDGITRRRDILLRCEEMH